jgi:hypothetical protein
MSRPLGSWRNESGPLVVVSSSTSNQHRSNGRAAFQKRVNVFAVYPHEFTGWLGRSQATIPNPPLDVTDSAAEKVSRLSLC